MKWPPVRALLATALLTMAVSGCLVPSDPSSDGTSTPNDLFDCTAVTLAFIIPQDDAQARLPDGFQAADASSMFGSSGSGQAVAGLAVDTCGKGSADSHFANLHIVTEPFTSPPDDAAVPDTTVYEVHAWSSNRSRVAEREAVGYSMSQAQFAMTWTDGNRISVYMQDSLGPLVDLDVLVENSESGVSNTYHHYQVTETGLARTDYEAAFLSRDALILGCSLGEGSRLATLLGTTDCMTVPSLNLVAEDVDFHSTFHYWSTAME